MKSKFFAIGATVVILIMAAFVAWPVIFVEKEEPLVFAVIPAEDGESTRQQFQPFVDYLEGGLGQSVELLTVSDYAAVVEAMKYGHADIARFGPANYVMAVDEGAGVEAIAAGIKESLGKPYYTAMLIARMDSEIDAVSNLNGASFAFVDAGSTSGYLVPSIYIEKAGVELGEVFMAGSHPAVILAVKNGNVDAGGVASNRYYTALEENVIEPSEIRILLESEPIPVGPIAVQRAMSDALKGQLLELLLSTPRDIAEHCGVGEIGYAKMSDADYDFIREIQAFKNK